MNSNSLFKKRLRPIFLLIDSKIEVNETITSPVINITHMCNKTTNYAQKSEGNLGYMTKEMVLLNGIKTPHVPVVNAEAHK